MAPAAAPMRNHLAARVMRRQALPPRAMRRASSRSLARAAVLWRRVRRRAGHDRGGRRARRKRWPGQAGLRLLVRRDELDIVRAWVLYSGELVGEGKSRFLAALGMTMWRIVAKRGRSPSRP